MPLLGKEEFTLKTLPPDLEPDSEIFYCEITGEAFVSYDEYFERQMLCSSLLWTCSVTGKTGLTYADALKSENESQTLLSTIPRVLQKVLLHLMSHLENFSSNVTIAVLSEYTNLRYFIGENVQILSKNKNRRVNGYIRDVIPPEDYNESCSFAYGIDPLSYQYVVEICESSKGSAGSKQNNYSREVVPVSRISRPKCLLTRDKIRLFLKQHISPKSGRYEALSIKEESIYKFGLDHLKWEDIFKGPTPNFRDDTTTVKAFNKRFSDFSELPNNDDDYGDGDNAISEETDSENIMQICRKKSNLLSSQKMKISKREEKNKKVSAINEIKENKKAKKQQKLKEKLEKKKLKKLKMKSKQKVKGKKKEKVIPEEQEESKESKEAKIEEKRREKETRRKFEEDSRSWLEKRDDLLCDDLKPLPLATVFDCDIEDAYISDSLSIIEFVNSFSDFLYIENVFPSGISIDLFAQILTDNDVSGPFFDLIKSLLYTIISSNSDESNVNAESDLNINENSDDYDSLHLNMNDDDDTSSNDFYTNFANYWVTTYFGTREQLFKLKLDAFTLTEILRIYILKAHKSKSKLKYTTDPEYIEFASKLTTCTVFAFDKEDRIKLIKLLINEIVKVPAIRQKIDESMEEIFKLKTQIRHLNAAFSKWLRDNPIRQRMRKKRPGHSEFKDESGAQPTEVDPEGEATQEEREQFKNDKTEKELEMKASISELKAEIRKLSAYCRPRPLGIDRSYRRYWIFQSVPGLIVEHPVDDVQIRLCFDSPTPMAKPLLTDYLPNARRRKRKNKDSLSNSNKENENEEQLSSDSGNSNLENMFNRCTGNSSTCSVHGVANINKRVQWSFYSKEHFDNLVDSLNGRGFRESELKTALLFEKKSILENHLQDFNGALLNRNYIQPVEFSSEEEEVEVDEEETNLRKSERIQRIQLQEKVVSKPTQLLAKHVKSSDTKYSNLSPMDAHEAELKDQLISLEDAIFNSCFGSFKYEEREDWYKNIALNFAGDRIKSMKNYTFLFRTLAESVRPFFLSPPLSVAQDSSAPSPSDKENIENILPKVPMLSEKWVDVLKVADGINSLGLSDRLNDYETSYGITNISQLFVNLYILNKSIKWDLSAMKTANKCRICRRKANDELILCDMCNRGYHIYCLNPPIASVDDIEGDWFCYSCHPRPRNIPKNTTAVNTSRNSSSKISHQEVTNYKEEKVVSYKEIEEDVDSYSHSLVDTSNCLVCKKRVLDKYSEVICKTCNKSFHLKCVELARIPRSWSCLPCEETEQYNTSANEDDNSDLRRSRRKRKPNNYYEYDPVDDNNRYSAKNRRYSLNSDNINIRRSSRRLGSDTGDNSFEPSSHGVLDDLQTTY